MDNDIKNGSGSALFLLSNKIEKLNLIFDEIQFRVGLVESFRNYFKEFMNCYEMKKLKILQVGGNISFFCCLSIAYQFSHCYYLGESLISSKIFNKKNDNPFFSQINQIHTNEIDKISATIEECELLIVFEQDQWNSIQILLQDKCITVIAHQDINYSSEWVFIYRMIISNSEFSLIHRSIYFHGFTLHELFEII